jgi:FeS assembly protein IscX
MGDKLTWDDVERIGVLLSRKHPELYPLSTDLAELHRRVTNLPGFQDNAVLSIRLSWRRFKRLGTTSFLIAPNRSGRWRREAVIGPGFGGFKRRKFSIPGSM